MANGISHLQGDTSIFRGLIGENRIKLNVSGMTILHLTVFERFTNCLSCDVRLTTSHSDAINKDIKKNKHVIVIMKKISLLDLAFL